MSEKMDDATQSLRDDPQAHEDNLLNQRVSWIVSSQAFLLTKPKPPVEGKTAILRRRKKNGRGGEIRTHDLLYPKQAR
jgi:hypothetical protein